MELQKARKITFIGGGSAYIPLIIERLIESDALSELRELVFISPTEYKKSSVAAFCRALCEKRGLSPKITLADTADERLKNSDLVFAIYRAGGLQARHTDETIGNDLRVLGQESQGFGGFASAMRNIAVLRQIAPVIREHCPNALFVNITNPSGIMTRAAHELGLKQAVGICDVPYAMRTKIAAYHRLDADKLRLDYIGLNHLGWIIDSGFAPTSNLLCAIRQRNIPDILPDAAFLQELGAAGAIPSSYLYYYYCTDEIIAYLLNQSKSRAQRVMEDNANLYRNYAECNVNALADFFGKERGAYLLGATVAEYIAGDNRESVICKANGTLLPFLPPEAVIETNMKTTPELPGHIRDLISTVARYEELAVQAG
ncbi:MAG: hypothetical protein FWD35_03425, partial [Oscillospiraceae bacterium]|nr:hypothetical protein [Oscillospiraceae bacterium]